MARPENLADDGADCVTAPGTPASTSFAPCYRGGRTPLACTCQSPSPRGAARPIHSRFAHRPLQSPPYGRDPSSANCAALPARVIQRRCSCSTSITSKSSTIPSRPSGRRRPAAPPLENSSASAHGPKDVACRYGGEEFVLDLVGSQCRSGPALRQELFLEGICVASAFSTQAKFLRQSDAVSIGIAVFPMHGPGAAELLGAEAVGSSALSGQDRRPRPRGALC